MCGITGIIHLDGTQVTESKIERFNNSQAHRGPDGSGVSFQKNASVALGHRRLSILDLTEQGSQPMSFADGALEMVFNGEIFNFIELKQELMTLGYSFKSETDSEVVMAAYHKWGEDCLARFNGMWALAIWDRKTESLFLARDRFGIKPLYYSFIPHKQFAFASETRTFKYLEGFERSFNAENIRINYENPYALEGRGQTIYESIFQLLPGHCMKFKVGESPKQRRWYDIEQSKATHKDNYKDQVEEFRALFKDACRIRLRSDVSVGTSLSGGLDSSSVYGMIQSLGSESGERRPKDWQKAFTAIFPNTPMDEEGYAQKVVEAYNPDKWIRVKNESKNLADEVASVTRHFDALSSTSMNSITSIYKSIKSNGITVSMDGHGVDEMLYGYRYMINSIYYNALQFGSIQDALNTANVLAGMYDPDSQEKVRLKYKKEVDAAFQSRNSVKGRLKSFTKRNFRSSEIAGRDLFHNSCSDFEYDFSAYSFSDQVLYRDFFVESLPAILRNFDRASMMHGVEVRTPFLDYRLVEYTFSLLESSKLGNGRSKRILRDAMRGILPSEVINRTHKIGVGAPLNDWLGTSLKKAALDILHSQVVKDAEFLVSEKERNALAARLDASSIRGTDVQKIWFLMNYAFICP
jgi:asparagine synthase (glutamine-hydrolysing)